MSEDSGEDELPKKFRNKRNLHRYMTEHCKYPLF